MGDFSSLFTIVDDGVFKIYLFLGLLFVIFVSYISWSLGLANFKLLQVINYKICKSELLKEHINSF